MEKENGSLRIACKTKDYLDLDELKEFQGDLKTISEADLIRLEGEILTTGMAFPFKVWKEEDPDATTNWIIGGHQTKRALLRIRDRGILIPRLPVVFVDCRDRKEAMRRVMQDASAYGKVIDRGLYDFMTAAEMTLPDLAAFRLPEVKIAEFENKFFPETKTVEFEAKTNPDAAEENPKVPTEHECPRCGYQW